MRLYLIRHAEVEPRYHRVFGGRIDMDLSETGLAQAERLGEWFAPIALDRLYTSPMQRAAKTARAIARRKGLEPQTLDILRETDFGAWTGLGWKEIESRFGRSPYEWLEALCAGEIPDAEPAQALLARARDALDALWRDGAGQSAVAAVAHGGTIRAMLAALFDLPLARLAEFGVDYAGVTLIERRGGRPALRLLNWTPWKPPTA